MSRWAPALPLEPLLPFLRTLTQEELAAVVSVSRRQVCRWLRAGRLPEHAGDAIACRLGLHPALVWDDWYDG